MSTKETRMQEGVVAFLDALGVKGIWTRANPVEVIDSWEYVLKIFDQCIEKAQDEAGPLYKDVYIRAFSDTVIVILKGKDPARLIPAMAELISPPFFAGLLKGIYFRGVISIGKFYQSQTLVIGPAIDEAAEWYTQPDWIGVSTAPSASFGIERLVEDGYDISKWFVKYSIPIKNGIEENGWAVAWPNRDRIGDEVIKQQYGITTRSLILDVFASRPISISAASKYKNTLAFFDFVMELNNKGSDG